MSLTERITVVAAVNDRKVLESNLLASACLRGHHSHDVMIQEGFSSASRAYNHAIERAANDLIIFVHQDMLLPDSWLTRLESALQYLNLADPQWGVVGCWGASKNGDLVGHVYSTGWGVLGNRFEQPVPVQTLDEIVLVLRKSSGLRFDDALPHFHFYGTDICMRAACRGLTSYAISAFCIHNTSQLLRLPDEFYDCYHHVRRVWRHHLPIQTTCIKVSKSNAEVYRRRFEDVCLRPLLRRAPAVPRATDPVRLLKEFVDNEAWESGG